MNSPKNTGGEGEEKNYLFFVVSEATAFQIPSISRFLHSAEKERI